jgi:hypothetical protein
MFVLSVHLPSEHKSVDSKVRSTASCVYLLNFRDVIERTLKLYTKLQPSVGRAESSTKEHKRCCKILWVLLIIILLPLPLPFLPLLLLLRPGG